MVVTGKHLDGTLSHVEVVNMKPERGLPFQYLESIASLQ